MGGSYFDFKEQCLKKHKHPETNCQRKSKMALNFSRPSCSWVIDQNNILHDYAGFRLACRSLLCRMIIACCFRVVALSGHAAFDLSPSGITPELNRIQLSAICRGGQSGKVIDLLARRCLPLGHPSAAKWRLRSCTNIIIKAAMRRAAS